MRHRHAAHELRAIFAREQLREQVFRLAELACFGKRTRPIADFAQRLSIGGDPSEAVDNVLLAINGAAIDLAAAGDTRPHSRTRGLGIGACGIGGGVESGKKVSHGILGWVEAT